MKYVFDFFAVMSDMHSDWKRSTGFSSYL